jgi:hypothetical protein
MQGASHLLDCLFEEFLIVAPTLRAHPAGIRSFDYLVDVEAVDEHHKHNLPTMPCFTQMFASLSTKMPPWRPQRPQLVMAKANTSTGHVWHNAVFGVALCNQITQQTQPYVIGLFKQHLLAVLTSQNHQLMQYVILFFFATKVRPLDALISFMPTLLDSLPSTFLLLKGLPAVESCLFSKLRLCLGRVKAQRFRSVSQLSSAKEFKLRPN